MIVTCPICHIQYANLPNHIRLKHPNQQVDTAVGNVGEAYPTKISLISNAPTTPSKSLQQAQEDLEKKRLLVDEKRLDLEMEKLTKGTKDDSPWDKLLQFQAEANKQQLSMLQELNDAKIENLRLELIGNNDSDLGWINQLLPYLPQILNKGQIPPSTNTSAIPTATLQAKEKGVNDKMEFDLSKVPKSYLKDVEAGKINEDKAWSDMQSIVKPELMPTREDFHKEFERVKDGLQKIK